MTLHQCSLHQSDLFGEPVPAEPAAPAVFRGDPGRVRARLAAILDEARAAEVMPWDRATLRLHETVVPQMSRWLDADEAAAVRRAFADELARLRG